MSDVNELDYALLSLSLRELNALTDAAETHGLICGFICAGSSLDDSGWVNTVLGELDQDDILHTPAGLVLMGAYAHTFSQLTGFQFDFQLILPNDFDPLPLRVEAMTHWCQGFVTGLVLGGADLQLSEEVRDIVKECTQFMTADKNIDDSMTHDEAEEALFALVEHVRLSAIYLHSVFNNSSAQTTVLH